MLRAMPQTAIFFLKSPFGASRRLKLEGDRVLIGRSAQCAIRIDESGIPAVLGSVIASGFERFLVAENDAFPFIVNGKPVLRKKLTGGDSVAFESCEMVFDSVTEETFEPASPSVSGVSPWALFRPISPQTPVTHSDLLRTKDKDLSHVTVPNAPTTPVKTSSQHPSTSRPGTPATTWAPGSWAKLVSMPASQNPDIDLTTSLAMLDLGGGKATLSRRHGQCYATLVSGLVFCAKERLGTSPRELKEGDLIASGKRIYALRLPPTS